MGTQYDGKPYFCTTCGEPFEPGTCPTETQCILESESAAKLRAERKRPVTTSRVYLED